MKRNTRVIVDSFSARYPGIFLYRRQAENGNPAKSYFRLETFGTVALSDKQVRTSVRIVK